MSNIVIAGFVTGYETDFKPFLIDNTAFPVVSNCYFWRKRIKKKRGADFLGRLQRALTAQSLGSTDGSGTFTVNIFSHLSLSGTQPNASISLGSITITIGADIFTEPSPPNGTLTGSTGGTGTINYSTGALTITGAPITTAVTITFAYYPDLPVLGLEDFYSPGNVNFPTLVAFDTVYSYQYTQSNGPFYDVTFFKGSKNPFVWTGQNFQQFYSTNYFGAMFVTNANPGFHFKKIEDVTATTATTATFKITGHALIINDWVFINELTGVAANTLNGLTGQVTATPDVDHFTATFVGAAIGAAADFDNDTGIAQYLTSNVAGTGDGIRWYDGDPTQAAAPNNLGWVNFAPPLASFDPDNPTLVPYLIGAKIVTPFKNRLLFFGVTIATKEAPAGVYYPNRMVYSQVGSPFYTGYPDTNNITVGFFPVNQTGFYKAWWENVVGFGGFLDAPIPQNIVTVGGNKDVKICHFETQPFKLIFTGDDAFPFIFQEISTELGAQSTFSSITLDTGILTVGPYGIAMTTQTSTQRIDLPILDQVFSISQENNASQRVTAYRSFRNEFVYFTYPSDSNTRSVYPNQTLAFNYRENNWSLFDENYSHYGTFRRGTGNTWATLNERYSTWAEWTDPWKFGSTQKLYPSMIGGNQQGFVMVLDTGLTEDTSEYIQNISGVTITSPAHGLNNSDYIELSGILGDPSMTVLNGQIFIVSVQSSDTFTLDIPNATTGTYLGGGVFVRLTNFDVITKAFPVFFEQGRKVRVGTQRYFLTNSQVNEGDSQGQITVNQLGSQNQSFAINDPTKNDYIMYSPTVLTVPEPGNPNDFQASEIIWHRLSNSFIGDTVQVEFTLSDAQMRDPLINSAEFELHAIVLTVYPGPLLS